MEVAARVVPGCAPRDVSHPGQGLTHTAPCAATPVEAIDTATRVVAAGRCHVGAYPC